tara:strand:- start:281 stop:886 length:606 start_codon:yes stop_codon:yes gene_type:complete
MYKVISFLLLVVFLTACSSTTKVKHEGETKSGMLEEVPKWYVEKVGGKGFLGKKDQFYIYGVGVATSPDLQLATDKATMIAKADIADVIKGEMNKKSQTYIEEVGQGATKNVVTETNSTIINIIKNTKVVGYERWKIEVSITPDNEYRVYMGLMLPIGEYNKLNELIEQETLAELNSMSNADEAFEDLDEISQVTIDNIEE